MRTAQELLDALAALPSGASFSGINSNGQWNITFAVITQPSPRRVTINRNSNADLAVSLDAGITVALSNLPE